MVGKTELKMAIVMLVTLLIYDMVVKGMFAKDGYEMDYPQA